ncbi:MAG TPA: SH3 domain-containing protein [Falsiroseomonas sp.]|jgi:hypothetical protein|nr:SH3 domain-containing protein [Falsiroseomonas sp.]
MAYAAEISEASPTCILFVIDQSGSMSEDLEPGVTKASFLADVLNRTLMDLVLRFRGPEGVRNCLDVGVIAYSGGGVGPGFGGVLAGSHLCELGALAQRPMRVEKRRRRVPDGIGGLVESEIRFPVWFDPQASGGTPMCAALRMAGELLADWCREHPDSFPPTVLHVTDGEATDGSPAEVEAVAARLMSQRTGDGDALLFNLHVSGGGGEPVRFPAAELARLNAHARLLFRISSVLPEAFQRRAAEEGVAVGGLSRGYVYNGRLDDVVAFFNVGARLRRGGAHWVKARAAATQGPPSWLPPPAAPEPPPLPAEARLPLAERWARAGAGAPVAQAPLPALAPPAAPPPAAGGRDRLPLMLVGFGVIAGLAVYGMGALEQGRRRLPEPPAAGRAADRALSPAASSSAARPAVLPVGGLAAPPAAAAAPPPVSTTGQPSASPPAAAEVPPPVAAASVDPASPVLLTAPAPMASAALAAAPTAPLPPLPAAIAPLPPTVAPAPPDPPAPIHVVAAPEPVAGTAAAGEPPPAPWPGRVVTVIAANVREGPNTNSEVARIASQGLSLRVYGRFGGWLHVGDGAGPWGWVHSSLLVPQS